jgi:hypothetical protein
MFPMGILDNAKEIASAVHEIQNLDLYRRVLDLNAGIMDLVDENRKLHAEIEDLQKKLQLREKMTFKEPFYFQDGDNTPFCPACWECKASAIHLHVANDSAAATLWHCAVCKSNFTVMKARVMGSPQAPQSNGPDSWMG